jgi:hypothetical protein
MAKNKKKAEEQTIMINNVEHKVSDLSQEQIAFVNNVADLDRKLDSAKFNITQMQGGRNYFMNLLEASLEDK